MSTARPPAGPAFLGLVAGILGTLHLWVWLRVAPTPAGAVGVLLGAVLIAAVLAARISGRKAHPGLATAAYGWLGLAFLAFTVSVVLEPVRWFVEVPSAAIVAAVLALAGFGLLRGRRPVVTRTTVPIPGLDPSLDGFRIVQLSDVHVGDTIGRGFVQRVVDTVNALSPDLVAITGDLVDGTVPELADGVAPLAGLRATHGTWFVTGNHEYYAGADAWIAHLRSLGIGVLRNERVRIGTGLDLVGVDDVWGRRWPGHGFDLARAVEGRDPSVPAILLSHQPVTVDAAADAGIALQLSGHTHGGQIFPFGLLVRTQQPYLAGLVRHRGTALYVHRGTGYWGPPMRIGAPSEIAVLTLSAAERSPDA